MTIILNPQTEAKLLAKAVREGQDPNAIANDVLSYFLEKDAPDALVTAEDIREAIQAERAKPIEQYAAEQRVKRGHSTAWPPRDTVHEAAPGIFIEQE